MATLADILKEGKKHISEVAGTLAGNERIKERSKGYAATLKNTLLNNYPMLSKDPQNVTVADILGSGLGAMPLAIKAFHGSPHKFDAFDMSKIGTGEGAQAYGHGLYFAESPDVATEYRDALAGVEVGGKIMRPEWDSPYYYPLQALRKHEDNIEKARIDVYERNKKIPGGWPEELEAFEDIARQGINRNQGNLYETSLQWPDPAREAADPLSPGHFIDFDKSINEQPDNIKQALAQYSHNFADPKEALTAFLNTDYAKSFPDVRDVRWAREILTNPAYDITEDGADWIASQMRAETGSSFYNLLGSDKAGSAYERAASSLGGQPKATEALRKAGIPGIRYLDQGSRGAGDGTYNYVIFDDQIPKIVKRNGVALRDILK